MRIAVASQNFRTVTGHVGKTRRFFIFEAEAGQDPVEVERLDLDMGQSLHDQHDAADHPLFSVNAIIGGSMGPGFVSRMAGLGIVAMPTSETDPVAAARALVEGRLAPPMPDLSGHDHPHGHGHDHGHGHGHGQGGCNCGHH